MYQSVRKQVGCIFWLQNQKDGAQNQDILTSRCRFHRHKLRCSELRVHSSGYRWGRALALLGQRECIDWDYGGALGKGSSVGFLFNLSPLRPPHLFWEQQAEIWSNAECHMRVCLWERHNTLMRACWGCECVKVMNVSTVCVCLCAYIKG